MGGCGALDVRGNHNSHKPGHSPNPSGSCQNTNMPSTHLHIVYHLPNASVAKNATQVLAHCCACTNVPSCPDANPSCPPPPSGTNLHVVHHLPTSSAICSSLRKEHGYVTANVTRPLQQLCVGGGAPRQLVGCVQGCCCVAAAATETSTCWDSTDYSSSDALPAMPY